MIQIPITRLRFESTLAQLTAQGVKFGSQAQQDTGTAEYQGVKVSFHFDERTVVPPLGQPETTGNVAKGILKLTVLAKPFLVPQSQVEDKIREWFNKS